MKGITSAVWEAPGKKWLALPEEVGESFGKEVTFALDTMEWVGTFQAKKGGNASQKKTEPASLREVNVAATLRLDLGVRGCGQEWQKANLVKLVEGR